MCAHGVCVCSLLCVCALGWVKRRVQIQSMGHHTWPHVTSLLTPYTQYTQSHTTIICPFEQTD